MGRAGNMAAALALAWTALPVGEAVAQAMTGEQIQAALAGNTVVLRANNQRFWAYYKDAQAVLLKSDQGASDEGVWRVTPDGGYCAKWRKMRQGAEACWKNVRLEGSLLRMDGTGAAADSTSEIMPGNPQGF